MVNAIHIRIVRANQHVLVIIMRRVVRANAIVTALIVIVIRGFVIVMVTHLALAIVFALKILMMNPVTALAYVYLNVIVIVRDIVHLHVLRKEVLVGVFANVMVIVHHIVLRKAYVHVTDMMRAALANVIQTRIALVMDGNAVVMGIQLVAQENVQRLIPIALATLVNAPVTQHVLV